MSNRVAILAGFRTPFCRAGGLFKDIEADDLGASIVKQLIDHTGFPKEEVEELIFGNVLQPNKRANIARVIAIKASLPLKTDAYTVNRNCASGMEAITSAAAAIQLGKAQVIIAGGVESMSNFEITFSKQMRDFLSSLTKAKTWQQKINAWLKFRPSLLMPQSPQLFDPLCEMNMGQTAELLSREWEIDRAKQDNFALSSQLRAAQALNSGRLAEEILPIALPPNYDIFQAVDDGIRENQTLEALSNLKPVFDRMLGSVTAGNSSQMTDGAVALLLASESKAKELGCTPLGYIKDYAYAGLDPARMGLGPTFATSKLLKRQGMRLEDIDLIEINEAFAAQVLACLKAFASKNFASSNLGISAPLGQINLEKMNVNGGAIALGHPLGASGARLVLTLLLELNRRNKNLGLATLCVGGGQGGAILLERG